LKYAKEKLKLLSLYQRFEQVVIMFLTALIAVIVIAAVWNLRFENSVRSRSIRKSRPVRLLGFPSRFGTIFTVIIALEFKKSLLVMADRRDNVGQVR
jgi:chromate transport protein ChrA